MIIEVRSKFGGVFLSLGLREGAELEPGTILFQFETRLNAKASPVIHSFAWWKKTPNVLDFSTLEGTPCYFSEDVVATLCSTCPMNGSFVGKGDLLFTADVPEKAVVFSESLEEVA